MSVVAVGGHPNGETTLARLRRAYGGRSCFRLASVAEQLGCRATWLAVLLPGKLPFHFPAVLGLGPLTAVVSGVEGDHGAVDAQLFAAQLVVVLGVIAFVRQDPVWMEIRPRLSHGCRALRRGLAEAGADHDPGDQVAGRMGDGRELGPTCPPASPGVLAPSVLAIGADVMGFQAGGVDSGFGIPVDQATGTGPGEASGQEVMESPFFMRRPDGEG